MMKSTQYRNAPLNVKDFGHELAFQYLINAPATVEYCGDANNNSNINTAPSPY